MKKNKVLFHQDLDIRIAHRLNTHLLAVDGGLAHFSIGHFLQFTSDPIYVIVFFILIAKLIDRKLEAGRSKRSMFY